MSNAMRYRGLITALLLTAASAAHAGGDCYNDEHPLASDFEPPRPGSGAELLRITDNDVARVLAEIRAYEARHAGTDATTTQRPARESTKR